MGERKDQVSRVGEHAKNYVGSTVRGLRARFDAQAYNRLQGELTTKAFETGNISRWDEVALKRLPLQDRVLIRGTVATASIAHALLSQARQRS